ncbi:ribonuclease Z [uncultured Eudoraea sp.]|uniref:ribonuclease Z n=1 Tax=uncultured Eudoraea sp. TaxID=1035614 RepID=UPI0026059BE7|nr:ribonuclease Z [uncultured Eudoraea sp.]
MIFDKAGNTTIVYQENISLKKFMENLNKSYQNIKNDHLIINLFSFSNITSNDILEFLQISNTHRAANKSFVLVTNKVEYDQVPDEICLVPTIREAKDIIEMEEIERDLDL